MCNASQVMQSKVPIFWNGQNIGGWSRSGGWSNWWNLCYIWSFAPLVIMSNISNKTFWTHPLCLPLNDLWAATIIPESSILNMYQCCAMSRWAQIDCHVQWLHISIDWGLHCINFQIGLISVTLSGPNGVPGNTLESISTYNSDCYKWLSSHFRILIIGFDQIDVCVPICLYLPGLIDSVHHHDDHQGTILVYADPVT